MKVSQSVNQSAAEAKHTESTEQNRKLTENVPSEQFCLAAAGGSVKKKRERTPVYIIAFKHSFIHN